MTVDIVPLICPHCLTAHRRSVSWVQENLRLLCEHCGTGFAIDKDRVALWLAEAERREERPGAAPQALG